MILTGTTPLTLDPSHIYRVQLAFPRAGTVSAGGFWGWEKLSAVWPFGSGTRYGHVDLLFRFGYPEDFLIIRTSATMRDSAGAIIEPWFMGTPATPEGMGGTADDFDFIDLPDDFAIEAAWKRANDPAELGSGYDYAGLAKQVLPFWKQDPKRWFCSEWAAYILAADPRFAPWVEARHNQFSPNALAADVTKFLATGENPV